MSIGGATVIAPALVARLPALMIEDSKALPLIGEVCSSQQAIFFKEQQQHAFVFFSRRLIIVIAPWKRGCR